MIRAVARLYADAFEGLPGDVWRLSAGLLVNRAGTMVLPFLSLYLVHELGFSTAAASTVLFAFGAGSVVGSYAGGAATGRWGTLRVQLGSLVLAGAGFLVMSQLRTAAAMGLGFFLVSAVNDAYRPACMTSVVDAAPPAVRARALGLVRLAANAGMAIGPAVGGVVAAIDYRLIFVGDAATCWLAALWLWRSLRGREIRRPEARVEPAAVGRSLWTDGPFLILLGLILVSALVLFQAFFTLPLYLKTAYGLDEARVGLVLGWNAALIVVFEMLAIKRLERRDPALVVGVGMFLMCAGFALLPLGHGLAFAALAAVVWTSGEILAFPFSNVLVAQRAAPGRIGQAMGMYSATFGIALILAPVVGLWVLDRFGGGVLWAAAGLVGPPLWILMALLSRSLRRPVGGVTAARS